jgi:hypothetical protein
MQNVSLLYQVDLQWARVKMELVHADVIPRFHFYECYNFVGKKIDAKIRFKIKQEEGVIFLFPSPPLVICHWYTGLSSYEQSENTNKSPGVE